MLSGERPLPGARAGTDALNLADYDRLFRSKTIYTGFRREEPDVPLFRQLLGPAFDDLPPRLRELHDSKDVRQWSGVAEIRRGQGILARMISTLVGFPQAAKQVPVSVTFTPEKGKERWTRNFGGRRFSSTQSVGMGKDQYLLAERFGIVTVALALVLDGGRLALIPRRWHVLGVPLPGFLLPKGESFESEENGRFCFDVEISLPFVGLVVAYKGTLERPSVL
jgi:alkylated DNA nucleotide flippase Atl1